MALTLGSRVKGVINRDQKLNGQDIGGTVAHVYPQGHPDHPGVIIRLDYLGRCVLRTPANVKE